MKSINIVECKNEDDLKEVSILAEKIWHEFFPGIISEAQIDYMVVKFQSFDAMQDQVKHQQYHYKLVGYIGLQNQPDRLFLSKLYLKDSARGKHYATEMFEYVKKQAEKYCYPSIYLTCNKYNKHSLAVYEKFGFQWIDSVQTDIGNGFIMDDYILEYRLGTFL
mgnify:FL=1